MKKRFISSTIGMLASHENLSRSVLVRVEFYSIEDGVLLVPVSGHNLATIKPIKQVVISSTEFNDREEDPYDSQVEFRWAIKKLGFE